MITIAIPYKGRSLEQVLGKFTEIDAIPAEDVQAVIEITKSDKARIKEEKAQIKAGIRSDYSSISVMDAYLRQADLSSIAGNCSKETLDRLQKAREQAGELTHMLEVGYDPHRAGQPARLFFRGLDTAVGGISMRLIGKSHYDIPTSLRNHTASIGLVGWDELYADHISHLSVPDIREWSALNSHLEEGSTDVRIIGSARLNDFTGHFVMAHDTISKKIYSIGDTDYPSVVPLLYDANDNTIPLQEGGCGKIYVDHKYQAIYHKILPQWTAEFEGVSDVEEEIEKNQGVGIYVVQSGRTAKDKDFHLIGDSLLTSETVIAVNIEDVLRNDDHLEILKALNPQRQTSTDHVADESWWYAKLCECMGDNYRFGCLTGWNYPWQNQRNDGGFEFRAESTIKDRTPYVEPARLLIEN